MTFSWNSTHTAIVSATSIVIAAMHYGVDIITIAPIIVSIGGYAVAREIKRIKD